MSMDNIENILDRLQKVRKNGQGWIACCPAHEDKSPSLSINTGDDGRILLHCHAGCVTEAVVSSLGLKPKDLFSTTTRNPYQPRNSFNGRKQPTSSISLEVVEKMHVTLTDEQRAYLKERRMLSDKIIDQYRLGLHELNNERRISIPIIDQAGNVVDVRLWLPTEKRADDSSKILHWARGYGGARLFPVDQLKHDNLLLCEGELDALAAIANGIVAITATCSVSTWNEVLSQPFKEKNVTILMDNDEAGQKGSKKRADLLVQAGAIVRMGRWPEGRKNKWDVTDELKTYGIDSLKRIVEQAEPFIQSASDSRADEENNVSPKGNSQAKQLVSLALDKLELFHDERGEPYAVIIASDGRRIISLGSKDFSRWLSQLAWKQLEKAVGSEVISTTRQTLSGIARFEGEEKTLHNRVAWQDGAIWIDLDGQKAICVKPSQWSLIANPPILFRSLPHQKSMPIPVPGGDPWQIFDFLNIKQDPSQLLFLCYLVASLVPDIPVVVLILHGQQGSAKTTILKVIKRLLDPSIVEVRGGISDQTEFAQFAFQNRLLFFDNLTKLPEWLSDCLCRTVSGEGWSKRSLFTDEDTTVFAYQRVVGLAGINLVAEKSDLLERSIIISLEAISPERRRDEETFWQEFNAKKGEILGGLLDALSKALQIKPSLNLNFLPRMADFTRWGCAASIGLGKTSEDFLEAFKQNVGFQNEAAIEASLIAQVFIKFMEDKQEWKGASGDLLGEFDKVAETLKINTRTKGWPKNPSWFSRRLKEVTPNLTSLGFEIEENRFPKKREISIRKLGENGVTGDIPSQKASHNAQNDSSNGNDTNDTKNPFETEDCFREPGDDDTGEFCEVEDMFDPSEWAEAQLREPGEEG